VPPPDGDIPCHCRKLAAEQLVLRQFIPDSGSHLSAAVDVLGAATLALYGGQHCRPLRRNDLSRIRATDS
jgi:hypothetical protein